MTSIMKISVRCLALAATLGLSAGGARALDLDGDNKDDRTVYRPSEGTWYVSSSEDNVTYSYQWGLNGDYPVGGNYTSTTGADLVVWRPSDGYWYIREYNDDLTYTSASAYQWGLPSAGDKPYPCDFNGDGKLDLSVYRPAEGNWYVRNSAAGASTYSTATVKQWGLPGDVPVPADYDVDGTCDYTVFRDGVWYVTLSSDSSQAAAIAWGQSGDVPVPGYYDNDSILDMAVYRENATGGPLWIIRKSNLAGLTTALYQWGLPGDLPVPADYDGDGKTDIAVWRPTDGVWYVRTSSSSYATAQAFQFGLPGDIPQGERRGTDPS